MNDWEKIAEIRRTQVEMHRANARLFLGIAVAAFISLVLILSAMHR